MERTLFNMDYIKQITLHHAEFTDLSEIYSLCQEIAKNSTFSKWSNDYPNKEILFQDIEGRTLYKVVHENSIISIIQIRSWDEFMKNEEANDLSTWDSTICHPCGLGRFCVSPSLQGAGIGRRVLESALIKAYKMGYDGAFFHVVKGNFPAIHLYESMGFHYVGNVDEYGLEFLCYEMKLDASKISLLIK